MLDILPAMLNNVSLALCSADGLVPSTLVPRPISAKFAGSRLQAGNRKGGWF